MTCGKFKGKISRKCIHQKQKTTAKNQNSTRKQHNELAPEKWVVINK